MKRIAAAAVAATTALTIVANPAFAAEEKVGSSEFYKECKAEVQEDKDWVNKAESKEEKDERQAEFKKEYGSSTVSGACIKEMTEKDSEYRSSVLGLLIGVPIALVALLGAAAAFSGAIPGVSLPAIPGLPM